MNHLFWEGALVRPLALWLQLPELLVGFLLLFVFAWTLYFKASALYEAARHGQRVWFVVFLLVHTVGILELIYLVWFRKEVLPRHTHLFPLPDFDRILKREKK